MDSKTKMWQMISVVSLIIAVVALIMPFVIPAPEGPEGLRGVAGDDGQDGDDGDTGPQGETGAQGLQGPPGSQGLLGATGANGTACWDLNGNGVGDIPAEDMNGDLAVDVNDCIGPPGPGSLIGMDIASGNVPLTGTCQWLTGAEVWLNVTGPGIVTIMAQADLDIDHVMGTEDYWRLALSNNPGDCAGGEWRSDGSIPSTWESGTYATHASVNRAYSVPGPGTLLVYLNGRMMSGAGAGDQMDNANIVAVFYPS